MAMDASDTTRDEPLVYVATVANEPLAQMWIETLGSAGIRAMAKPLGPGFGAWASVSTFEHELYVLESQLDAALAVIRDVEGSDVWEVPPDTTPE
jgi:hypothetical protein